MSSLETINLTAIGQENYRIAEAQDLLYEYNRVP